MKRIVILMVAALTVLTVASVASAENGPKFGATGGSVHAVRTLR
ncbi:MAG TPA: hypothetical protein VD902_14660 [Symbiobacteriaceae bacterium]|nr:hypothetical protein [Symbiobacteriaceae bacterium]